MTELDQSLALKIQFKTSIITMMIRSRPSRGKRTAVVNLGLEADSDFDVMEFIGWDQAI